MSTSAAETDLLPPQSYLLEWSNKGIGFGIRNVDVFQLLPVSKPSSSSWPSQPRSTSILGSFNPRSGPEASGWTRFADDTEADADEADSDARDAPSESDSKTAVRGGQVYHIRHLKWRSKSYELYETVGPAGGEDAGIGAAWRKWMEVQQEGDLSLQQLLLAKQSHPPG